MSAFIRLQIFIIVVEGVGGDPLGNQRTIDKISESRLALDLILFGSILIMGLYHFTLFRSRKQDFHKPIIFFIVAVYFLLSGILYLTPAKIFTIN